MLDLPLTSQAETASSLVATTQFFKSKKKMKRGIQRIFESQFEFLAEKLSCSIAKEDAQVREYIKLQEIVFLTLCY